MFLRKKKHPLLTATYCSEMEHLRQAIEVLTGERTMIRDIDFNTREAHVYVGDVMQSVSSFSWCDYAPVMDFSLTGNKGVKWYVAHFPLPGLVGVSEFGGSEYDKNTVAGRVLMWSIGRSYLDRRIEPFDLEYAERRAKAHGMTVEELLAGKGL